MSTDGDFDSIQVAASADLSALQYHIVSVAGTMAVSADAAAGVLQNAPQSGEHASLAYSGHMKGKAGGAITVGARLTVTASGTLSVVTSGSVCVGKALAAASSGGLCSFIGDFSNASATA